MKPTFYYLLLTAGLALGCRDNENEIAPSLAEPVTFTTIDANVSDFPPDYSIDANRAEGELHVEENFFIELPANRFALNSSAFRVEYNREVIQDSRINQNPMSRWGSPCDDSEDCFGTIWEWTGFLTSPDSLVWQFVDFEQPTQGYRWVMTEKPQQIRVTKVPDVLRPGQPQVISFEKASDEDRLQLELVVIAKDMLLYEHTLPIVTHTRTIYDPSAWIEEAEQLTLLSEQVDYIFSGSFALAETDTAFWNVASVRKIVKEIDSVRFELTYQVNNLTPIRIEFE